MPRGGLRTSGKMSGGFQWKYYAKEISVQNVLPSGRARQGYPVGCYLGGEIRHLGYHHKRKWKPLSAHQEGVCWYHPLGG